MIRETLKPIPVSSPKDSPLFFYIRCMVDLQLKTIVDFLRPELRKTSGVLLDVGAGNAPWRYYLSNNTVYVGLDIESASDFNMNKSADIVYYSGNYFPFKDNEFDFVLCIEVMEHVYNIDNFLNELFRCMKPSGRLLLTVPWSARRHHLPHDYFRFTPEALIQMFEKRGFKEVNVHERGNDFCTIFNKIICIILGLLFPSKKIYLLVSVPLAIALLPSCVFFLIISHLTMVVKIGSKIDPLGYALTATKI